MNQGHGSGDISVTLSHLSDDQREVLLGLSREWDCGYAVSPPVQVASEKGAEPE